MIETPALLRSYIRGIRRLSGAESASLFIPTLPGGLFQPFLLHDGNGPPVPELASLEAAELHVRSLTDPSPTTAPLPILELLPSSEQGCVLIVLPGVEAPWELARFGVEGPARRRSDVDAPGEEVGAWLGLRFAATESSIRKILTDQRLPSRLVDSEAGQNWWEWLFVLGGALASHTSQVTTILKDPVTGLADRKAFQAVLSEQIERAAADAQSLSLLLLNPDRFAEINQQLGREAGDRCIREISERLRPVLRMTDLVARYGGVVFAAILPDTPESEAQEIAHRVTEQLQADPYIDGRFELGFSIGFTTLEPQEAAATQPLELVRRADRALNAAKREGGGRIVSWREVPDTELTDGRDRLSGIFTGNMSKDYRNMALLHDTIDILGTGTEFEGLTAEVVNKLFDVFTPDRIGVFGAGGDNAVHLIAGVTRRESSSGLQSRVETVELEPSEREEIESALSATEAQEIQAPGFGADDTGDSGRTAFVAPLRAGSQQLGCLFIEGRRSSMALEHSDLIFLDSLAAQVSVALDRARLTARERAREEQERRRLRAELSELRQALQHVKMVYRSAQMEELIGTVKRVAPTDATVLITGESGTGKELLARTIHELSPRQDRPFVIVDCGAISSTLIESELFGHEKGAYTGAQQRRAGRLFEASEGTVLLDEIGELPLEVQSKLLRFVQDKEFTTVGGSKPRTVDVRIIAATNRDLAAEVQAGRFREDLFHRLHVVRLEIPPLRERPDDILHLARHFLDLFSIQYQKGVKRLGPEAEALLLRSRWPGNVRELQNRILQSVILTEGESIGPEALGFGTRPAPPSAVASAEADGHDRTDPATEDRGFEARLAALRQQLGTLIEHALSTSPPLRLPLGTWLRDDLLLAASETKRTAREAAALIGMPESTFRRRLRAAGDERAAGLSSRTEAWSGMHLLLADLVRSAPSDEADLHARTQEILLEEILARLPGEVGIGAQLLGVSPPTFRRRVRTVAPDH